MRRLAWTILALGATALIVDPMRLPAPRVRPLALVTAGEDRMGKGGFVADAAYPSTDRRGVPAGLTTRGSWVGSDAFQGSQLTPWFRACPRVSLMVAGYPALAPNQLTMEARLRGGTVVSIPFRGENPGETWQSWTVELPPGADAVRVRAVDGSSTLRGWLAFSEPFRAVRDRLPPWSLFQLATATCLALTLICGPGLLWFLARPRAPGEIAFAVLVGPLSLALLGLACWWLGGWIAPAAVARGGIAVMLALLVSRGWRLGRGDAGVLSREAAVVVTAGALLVGFAVAKANLSYGPAGELYGGTISRTLEVGLHSDSRISYHVVQVVALHLPPFSPQAEGYFLPYSFASRGPLAGLLAAPLVLATGGAVPADKPDQAWQPFDPQGFAVYRVALIVLASLAGWAVFGVVATALDGGWALLACATVLLTPFFIHELYFTWPKMMAATCTLVAFQSIATRRPLAAGVVLAIGYLFHPLAILSAPFLALWLVAGRKSGGWIGRCRPFAWFGGGVLSLVLLWQAVGRMDPAHVGSQSGFLDYFLMANWEPATWKSWCEDRWESLVNTFVPFAMLSVNPDDAAVSSIFGRTDGWIRFGFLYWSTFPFALGLPTFLLTAPALVAAIRRTPAAAFAVVVGPAGLLIVYWGAGHAGLMRYCGHVLFLSSIPFAVWTLAQPGPAWQRWCAAALAHPLCVALRGLEIAWMAFGSTLHHHIPDIGDHFGWNDWISLLVAAICLTGALVLLARALRDLAPPGVAGIRLR